MTLTMVVSLHLAVPWKKFGASLPMPRGHGFKSMLKKSMSMAMTATNLQTDDVIASVDNGDDSHEAYIYTILPTNMLLCQCCTMLLGVAEFCEKLFVQMQTV